MEHTVLTNRRALLGAASSLFVAALLAGPALANDPARVVTEVSNQVVDMIKGKQGAERQAEFAAILQSRFDLPLMGQSALGQYWARASEDQRQRFLRAAAAAEARAYSERFGQYGGQTVTVGRVLNRPNGVFVVESTITQSGGRPPIRVEWELQDRGAGLRVTDVKVEGVSMVMTRRSDFSSFISRNGGDVEVLIKELESRAK
jgi:phospholipid transport system substrate-binding protein